MATKTIDKSRVRELKRALSVKTGEIDAITNVWEVNDAGTIVVDDAQHAAYAKAVVEAQRIKSLLDQEMFVSDTRGWLDAPEGGPVAGIDAAAAAAGGSKSLGAQFLGSDEWTEFKDSRFRGGTSFTADGSWWVQDPSGYGQKDIWRLAAGTVPRSGFGEAEQRPLAEKLPRQTHIRELFPAEETSAAVLFGIRQTGFVNSARPVRDRAAADGVAAPVGDDTDTFGRAPRSKLTFETVMYPIAEIAHVEYVHQTVLEDEPRLRGVIDRQMVEGVRVAEDQQILFGDGANPNLRGIANTPGVQVYNQPTAGNPATASERKTVTLRRAITRVQLANLAPTGVVVNPLDWEDMELEVDEQGRLILVTSVAAGAEERVWRLPVVPTTAMPEGKYLLGAFGAGAQLFDRRQVSVLVSTENRDQFEQGGVTFKGSERVGLTVDRPEAFVAGTLVG